MSDQALNPAQAEQVLLQEVYLPTFIDKCAQAGLVFENEEMLGEALESVAILKQANTSEVSQLTKAAAADLREVMGVEQPEQRQQAEQAKEAAAQASRSDNVRSALQALAAQPK